MRRQTNDTRLTGQGSNEMAEPWTSIPSGILDIHTPSDRVSIDNY